MVRTRHSGDIEDVDSPKFMTLEKERFKSEASTKREIPDEDDINTPRGAYLDDEYELFEDKVVESRLRPRTGPRRAYNYLDADSSDDERGRRHRRHSPHKEARSPRSIKKELADDSDRKSRRISSRMSLYQEDAQEDNHQLRRSQRRSRHDQSVDDQSFEEDAKTRTGRRTLRVQNDEDEDTEDGHKEDEESDDEKEQDSDDEAAKDHDSDNEQASNAYSDMYSRVKRKRVRRSLNIYDDESQNRNNNQRDDTDEEEEPSSIRRSKRIDKKRGPPQIVKSYSLREHKPRTDLYKAPVEERRIKKPTTSIFEVTPTKKTSRQPYQSPAQRRKSRKRSAAMHSSSSSTSSSSGESSDEKSFRKRKAKSMAKARSRMMPMNFSNGQQPSSIVKDRAKSGASLADVEPMNIDKNISFDSIGGLGKHIRALKEMVVFPLLYDKVFQKFNVDPPRGVLFYGPPGTGKTLVARALANECSHGEKKVAFFMRKGADCLSKWVGESERQLRLLFDQAYKYRPSIIFFDEIDGLAPVRSSRQDQIHSSIVSTLLALMDGLDSRGEIVVIGATNRIDSLDPALRRPGRFDREFLFSLPTLEARKQILKIQTSSWNPKLNERFVSELAEKCVGYCGADLKSLCTEAAMLALRRRYPQIYISNEALQLDESSIQVCAKDFFNAVNNIIPTSRRSVNSPGRPLSLHILPLLQRQLDKAVYQLGDTFPPCLMKMTSLDAAATNKQAQAQTDAGMLLDDLASDEDDDAPSIFVAPSNKASRFQARKSLEEPSTSRQIDTYLNFASFSTHQPTTFRPRIMLTGLPGQGQTSYIAPALIHRMEDLPVHVLDLPALYAVTAKTPEESCATVFHEARRKCPSIIYMPYINQWWDVLGDTLRTTLLTLIQDLNPTTPLLLLATSEQPYSCLDIQLKSLFSDMSGEVMKMANPNAEERRTFFKDLILQHSCKAPPQKKTAAKRMLEVLPKAVPVKPKELTNQEMNSLLEKEELTLMELRIFLRDVLHKLGSDKKFSIFTKPVNIENAPDYYEVIDNPMDMSTMMSKIDCHEYSTVRSFMDDVDLICSNALEYNPDRGPLDKVIRHRACALKDTAYAIIRTELDKDFEKMCVEIEESRKRRGVKSTTVPNFYRTKPAAAQNGEPSSRGTPIIPSYLDSTRPVRSIPKPDGERFSRRVRGIQIDPTPSLEDVEKKKSQLNNKKEKEEGDDNDDGMQSSNQISDIVVEGEESMLSQEMISDNESTKDVTGANDSQGDSESLPKPYHTGAQTDPLSKKSRSVKKCVWCRPSRRRRKKFFQDQMNSLRMMKAAKDGKEEKNIKINLSPPVTQPLNIDVSESTETEMKSPVRKSARIVSPGPLSSGVTTRRQSLSPRASRPNVETKVKDLPQEENPVQETVVTEVHEESVDEVVEKKNDESLVTEKTVQTNSTDVSELLEKKLETLKDAVETEAEPKKLSVVKSLDLDFGVVDSGAGSSLEGNGDSRDSMDNKEAQPTTSSSQIKDFNENNNQDRATKDSSIFNDCSNKLVVPTQKLSNLLDKLVAATEGSNVECLEKIYSQLSQIIFKHRNAYNRSDMVTELEKKVAEMTRQLPSLSSSR